MRNLDARLHNDTQFTSLLLGHNEHNWGGGTRIPGSYMNCHLIYTYIQRV